MNFKFLFPTFLNRYLFVEHVLKEYDENSTVRMLHLGTGEGDFDPMLSTFCEELIACDYNVNDLQFASSRNAGLRNVKYRYEDALSIGYPDEYFDRVVAVEVIEHVRDPLRMMEEICRVMKPRGLAILTFPNVSFPITYDPINRFLQWMGKDHLSIGAYSFGHEYLISCREFEKWSIDSGLRIVQVNPLSGYLIGVLEMYWTGIAQAIFKNNALNNSGSNQISLLATRPGHRIPKLSKLVKLITRVDANYFRTSENSIGQGYVLEKQ